MASPVGRRPAPPVQSGSPVQGGSRLDDLMARIDGLSNRITSLENAPAESAPAVPPYDDREIRERIAELEAQVRAGDTANAEEISRLRAALERVPAEAAPNDDREIRELISELEAQVRVGDRANHSEIERLRLAVNRFRSVYAQIARIDFRGQGTAERLETTYSTTVARLDSLEVRLDSLIGLPIEVAKLKADLESLSARIPTGETLPPGDNAPILKELSSIKTRFAAFETRFAAFETRIAALENRPQYIPAPVNDNLEDGDGVIPPDLLERMRKLLNPDPEDQKTFYYFKAEMERIIGEHKTKMKTLSKDIREIRADISRLEVKVGIGGDVATLVGVVGVGVVFGGASTLPLWGPAVAVGLVVKQAYFYWMKPAPLTKPAPQENLIKEGVV